MNPLLRFTSTIAILATLSLGSLPSFAQQATPSQAAHSAAHQATKININTASAEEIADSLSGIGLKKAQAIVAWREAHGKFTSKEGLLDIKGIGESTLAKNKDLIAIQ